MLNEHNDFGINSIQKIKFKKKKNIPLGLGSKLDIEVKYFKVNLGASSKQTW